MHVHTHTHSYIFLPKIPGSNEAPRLEHWLYSITFSDVMESQTGSCPIYEDTAQVPMSPSIFSPSFPTTLTNPDLNSLPLPID